MSPLSLDAQLYRDWPENAIPSARPMDSPGTLPARVGVLFRGGCSLAVIHVTVARDKYRVRPGQVAPGITRRRTIRLTEPGARYYSRPHSLGWLKASVSPSGRSIAPMVTPEDLPRARLRSPALGSGSRGTQLPTEPGKHPSCSRAGSLPHRAVMVVTAFWCYLNLSCSTFC